MSERIHKIIGAVGFAGLALLMFMNATLVAPPLFTIVSNGVLLMMFLLFAYLYAVGKQQHIGTITGAVVSTLILVLIIVQFSTYFAPAE
jgi:hypothetical protein